MVLRTRPALEMDDEQLFEFCRINREWRIERTPEGELEIMPSTGGETSDKNAEITMQLRLWAKRNCTGHRLRLQRWVHPAQRRDAFSGRCVVAARAARGPHIGTEAEVSAFVP